MHGSAIDSHIWYGPGLVESRFREAGCGVMLRGSIPATSPPPPGLMELFIHSPPAHSLSLPPPPPSALPQSSSAAPLGLQHWSPNRPQYQQHGTVAVAGADLAMAPRSPSVRLSFLIPVIFIGICQCAVGEGVYVEDRPRPLPRVELRKKAQCYCDIGQYGENSELISHIVLTMGYGMGRGPFRYWGEAGLSIYLFVKSLDNNILRPHAPVY